MKEEVYGLGQNPEHIRF